MKTPMFFLLALAGAPLALSSPVFAADERLEAPVSVDWRGLPLRRVLNQLAQAAGTPYRLDDEAPPGALDRRVRLFAAHLTARQAFRWAARLAGLEAVVREDLVWIAPPRKLPRIWRLTGGSALEPPGWKERLEALNQRRESVAWIDTPLSGVARDLSRRFGIDVVFHPDILAEEPLLHLEIPDASLERIRTALQDQLQARTALMDGALWVAPSDVELDEPATRPSLTSPASEEAAFPAGPLDQFVILDRSVQSWQDFCDRLSRAGGVSCRAAPPGRPFPGPFEARGTLGEVLESARLLGWLTWRFVPADNARPAMLEIHPGSGKR